MKVAIAIALTLVVNGCGGTAERFVTACTVGERRRPRARGRCWCNARGADQPGAAQTPPPPAVAPPPPVTLPTPAPTQVTERPAPRVMDSLDLGTTSITGNAELPKVLYIVPWKKSDLGDLVGRPVNTLLDEVLAPVDPAVFERHLSYYDSLYGEREEE